MSRYKELSVAVGEIYLPNIWNIFVKQPEETEYFVEIWENKALRECCQIQHGADVTFCLVFCGHIPEAEALLSGRREAKAMLYGAYNQIDVCQMRASGTISHVYDPDEIVDIKDRLRRQVHQRRKSDGSTAPMNDEEVAERLKIIASQPMYRFVPESYAYAGYERG
jgi:hypothetical protein